jgi:LysM repeat protein
VALAMCSLMATQHVVRRGETLAEIADRYDVSVRALAEANGLNDPDHVVAGQRLEIPGDASPPIESYEVQRGDNLASIARRLGTTVSQLAAANGVDDPDHIRVGQRLVAPAAGAGSDSASGPGADAEFHVVQPGESLASIARRYGVSVSQIAEANGIVDGRVYADARVLLESRNSAPDSGSSTHHTVRPGEFLARIATRYGSSVQAISRANGLTDPDHLAVGQRLEIPTGKGSGIVCPVPGARFMNDFGFPRAGHFHEGNDLFAPRGTPVVAPVAGQVEHLVGEVGGYQLRLWGADGTTYVGSHLHAFGEGGRVDAGTVIGYVGDSGNARGGPAHLHFEMRPRNGPSVNPYPSLRAAC